MQISPECSCFYSSSSAGNCLHVGLPPPFWLVFLSQINEGGFG